MNMAIGVDIGGTSLRAALVDPSGNILASRKQRIEQRDPEALLNVLEALTKDLKATDRKIPMAVGLAAITKISTGTVVVAPNLDWHDVKFGPMLNQRFGRNVRLINDLDAITAGEAKCGAGRNEENVIFVFAGTGIGMGAMVQGTVLEGAEGLATEFGHIKIESVDTGRLCGCGQRGCLEAYTSGRHLPELFQEKVRQGLKSSLFDAFSDDIDSITPDRIEQAAHNGDAAALALWEDVAKRLGYAMGNLVTVFNPTVLVLGGGVLSRAPSLQSKIEDCVRATASKPHVAMLDIRNSILGDEAGLVGAGLLAHTA